MAHETRNGLPDICGKCRKLATSPRYLAREATISGYRLRQERMQALLLISDGTNWRERNLQNFCYSNGCWGQVGCLSVSCSRFLASMDGQFATLADSKALWGRPRVSQASRKVPGGRGSDRRNHVTLISVANVRSGHASIGASNKTYRTHWCERFEDAPMLTWRIWVDHRS